MRCPFCGQELLEVGTGMLTVRRWSCSCGGQFDLPRAQPLLRFFEKFKSEMKLSAELILKWWREHEHENEYQMKGPPEFVLIAQDVKEQLEIMDKL
jgi:hypothetical protein